jgi:hypothetical protein
MAGISIEGDNKWLTLIKTAVKHQNKRRIDGVCQKV